MAKQLTLGGIIGGVIVFFWGAISWMALPWHNTLLNGFTDENVVGETLKGNAPVPGIYMLPNPHKKDGVDAEYNATAEAAAHEKMRTGPFVFMSIRPNGIDYNMGSSLILSVVIEILGALIITFLLLQTQGLSYGKKVLFVVLAALAGGVICHLPYWNWWRFPTAFTLIAILDLLIGWALAGLAIAKICKN